MSCLRQMMLYRQTTNIMSIIAMALLLNPETIHIVKFHQPVFSCEHQFKNIFPVAIFCVRIANSIMHDTDLAGVGLILSRY